MGDTGRARGFYGSLFGWEFISCASFATSPRRTGRSPGDYQRLKLRDGGGVIGD